MRWLHNKWHLLIELLTPNMAIILVNDCVHGMVTVPDSAAVVMTTPLFQRLGRVKHLAWLGNPGGVGKNHLPKKTRGGARCGSDVATCQSTPNPITRSL
jgi:hypothetical protein